MFFFSVVGVLVLPCGVKFVVFATCTSPIMHLICPPSPPPKFSIAFVFHFSWVLQPSQEKLKTMLPKFGGTNKVHYGRCSSGE